MIIECVFNLAELTKLKPRYRSCSIVPIIWVFSSMIFYTNNPWFMDVLSLNDLLQQTFTNWLSIVIHLYRVLIVRGCLPIRLVDGFLFALLKMDLWYLNCLFGYGFGWENGTSWWFLVYWVKQTDVVTSVEVADSRVSAMILQQEDYRPLDKIPSENAETRTRIFSFSSEKSRSSSSIIWTWFKKSSYLRRLELETSSVSW